VLLVGWENSSDDKSADIVFLVEVEELSDLVSSLGSKSSVDEGVCEASDVLLAFSYDNGRNNAHIVVQDASSNRLSLPLTSSARSVAAHALLEQKLYSTVDKDTLLHGESLLVLTSGDSKDVALEFVAKAVGWDLVRDSLLEHVADFVLIVDFNGLLLTRLRVGDVNFHFCGFFVSGFLLSVSST